MLLRVGREVRDGFQIYIFYVTLLELQKLLERSAERETSEQHSRVLKENADALVVIQQHWVYY